MERTTDQVISGLRETWCSLLEATLDLDEAQWALATDCPGWDVQDQLSHLVGIERTLLGEATPEIEVPARHYVKNQIGQMNEAWIELLRQRTGVEVRAEFEAVTNQRLAVLEAMAPASFEEIGWSPIGQVPYRTFMVVRIMDSWLHEQDVRLAVGRPGGRDGIGEEIGLERADAALGVVVGKNASAPEGASVAFEIVGPLGGRRRIEVIEGRATWRDASDATCTITMSQEAYVRRFGGRISLEETLARSDVAVAGDEELATAVVRGLAVMI
jgi:uncharacterized protein (TIGR03083 family)